MHAELQFTLVHYPPPLSSKIVRDGFGKNDSSAASTTLGRGTNTNTKTRAELWPGQPIVSKIDPTN